MEKTTNCASIILILIVSSMGVPLRMTSFICIANPEICENNICRIRTVRKTITLLDYHCYHKDPITALDARMKMIRKRPNGKDFVMIDTHEDLCKILQNDGQSQLLLRVFKELQKYGLTVTKCPIQGNVTLMNWPFDTSYFPTVLLPGNYEIFAYYTDMGRKKSILNNTIYLTVKY